MRPVPWNCAGAFRRDSARTGVFKAELRVARDCEADTVELDFGGDDAVNVVVRAVGMATMGWTIIGECKCG